MGGLRIINPLEIADVEFQTSCGIKKILEDHIIQVQIYKPCMAENKIKNGIKRSNKATVLQIHELTYLPLKEEGFHLNKNCVKPFECVGLRHCVIMK